MSNETSKPEQIMTRDKFIRKWLGVISEYSETNRDRMRDDLDKVIESVQPQPTEARELPSELGQLFKNNSNCYADRSEERRVGKECSTT